MLDEEGPLAAQGVNEGNNTVGGMSRIKPYEDESRE